ncbi:hypothetical protein GCM10011521_11310 [Arenimonas soli]|uniref:CopL family metal-binding regulatory protein n=1 Tax=Arenimonas soli TaxID=2269504 RepID=A0ABQ1HF47_9GAMM|nr:CopL family metal-binding regulatory protein [Arenimonas soli]GGA74850.1 hypothetical protein GCM10011521_11310 [Arenimonas soli]
MPLFRVLSRLLLALALVAGGVAPGFAQDMHPEPQTAMQAPCHGMDGELLDAAPEVAGHGDCCDEGECRCDCLQHTTASVMVLRQLAPLVSGSRLAPLATASHAPARTLPATRPPIA